MYKPFPLSSPAQGPSQGRVEFSLVDRIPILVGGTGWEEDSNRETRPLRAMTGTTLIVGDCTAEFDGRRERTQRGHVVILVKPDDTVLVHDADGYRPVAWLTRPDSLTRDTDPTTLTARDGDRSLRVTVHDAVLEQRCRTSQAGTAVGACPDCDGFLVRAAGAVVCANSGIRYGLPAGATLLEDRCGDCGLPRMHTERGVAADLCVDRTCESLDALVKARFDREWTCPSCGDDLRIRRRGSLLAGCASYPECETGFAIPRGVVTDECACGLPLFTTDEGTRCLDATCGRQASGEPRLESETA